MVKLALLDLGACKTRRGRPGLVVTAVLCFAVDQIGSRYYSLEIIIVMLKILMAS